MKMRVRLARQLRNVADRLDHAGAPKRMMSLSVALEPGVGWVLRKDGTGVPVWYLGDQDYLRAEEPPRSQVGNVGYQIRNFGVPVETVLRNVERMQRQSRYR